MHRTFRVKARASGAQQRRLDDVLRASGHAYNAMLECWRTRYQMWRARHPGEAMPRDLAVNYTTLCRQITELRSVDEFWAQVSVTVLRGVAHRLDTTTAAFYDRCKGPGRRAGYPRFKPSARWRTVCVRDVSASMVQRPTEGAKWWRLAIKGLPRIRFEDRQGRIGAALDAGGAVKELRIVRTALRLEVHLVLNVGPAPTPVEHPERPVGIDPGVRHRLTLHNGERIATARPDRSRERQLRRRVSRADKNSNNRSRKRLVLTKHTARRAHAERQAVHRLAADLVARFDAIAMEDTPVKNLTGAAGARKRALNRRLLEQQIGAIKTILGDKAESASTQFVLVPAAYTTQTCSCCGALRPMPASVRVYQCGGCGLVLDRDHNAALNIYQAAFGGPPGGAHPVPERRVDADTSEAVHQRHTGIRLAGPRTGSSPTTTQDAPAATETAPEAVTMATERAA